MYLLRSLSVLVVVNYLCSVGVSDKAKTQGVFFLQTDFKDVIAEPDGVHSVDAVWLISYKTYTESKAFLYRGLSSIFSIPLSLIWGLIFALLSFLNIWVIVPFIKFCLFIFYCAMHPVLTCMDYWFRSPCRVVIGTVEMVKELYRKAI